MGIPKIISIKVSSSIFEKHQESERTITFNKMGIIWGSKTGVCVECRNKFYEGKSGSQDEAYGFYSRVQHKHRYNTWLGVESTRIMHWEIGHVCKAWRKNEREDTYGC